jgi:hypothetical protein
MTWRCRFKDAYPRSAHNSTSELAMKPKAPLIRIAGVVTLTVFASSSVSAQSANLAPPTNAMPRPGHWTTQNVNEQRPFGDIDVAPAGSSVESVRLWSLGRSVLERYEINGRCAVITTPVNAARYSESDQQFCRNYKLAGFARPVPPRS